MEYKELSRIYHMNTGASRDVELDEQEKARRDAASTFHTGFDAPNGELFIAVPRELSVLNERILRAERKVSRLIGEIPPIARDAVLRGIVLDEVVSTNAIENIHSTRRQVKDAIEASRGAGAKGRRFRELASLYIDIVDGVADAPTTVEEIRGIYDRAMDGEFEDEGDKPDGRLFRAHGVDITDGGARILHSGLEPEAKIIEAVGKMLGIANSDEIPAVLSAIASHYLFEYIHPFYDGNGRCGRYLLSLFLSAPLSKPTVLSLSRAIAQNRREYYRAFTTVEDPLNRGELTFFVFSMLELIRKAQIGVIDRFEKCNGAFADLGAMMAAVRDDFALKPQEAEAVFILMQYETFGLFGDASVNEIARRLGIGDQMARRHLSRLEEKSIVEKRNLRNPLTFALAESFKRKYGIEPLDDRGEESS